MHNEEKENEKLERGDPLSVINTIFVIPAKAGIQFFGKLQEHLGTGLRRCDDFCKSFRIDSGSRFCAVTLNL